MALWVRAPRRLRARWDRGGTPRGPERASTVDQATRRARRAPEHASPVRPADPEQALPPPGLPPAAGRGPAVPDLLAGPAAPGRGFGPSRAAMVLALQGTHGNQSVQRFIQRAAAAAAATRPRGEDEAQLADRI